MSVGAAIAYGYAHCLFVEHYAGALNEAAERSLVGESLWSAYRYGAALLHNP